uniref:NADH dehydrogenase subunit 6 n=1 Tax=Deltocephalinae sp. EMHAU-2015-Zz052318 TaxID=2038644 RepID=A0A343K623_9HEMI|nr:NADH dehydrogenase subunit 6 [Deltocephalinae sp. EMHAU-2015-Zz052318]
MKMITIKIMMMISSSILFMKTPMSMGSLLLTQTFLSTILLTKMLPSSWMPLIMFLMLVGGLLILFMYMSSIASNEKFMMNSKFIIMMVILIIPIEELVFNSLSMETLSSTIFTESITMNKIFNMGGMMVTILMFCYLLLTMIAVTIIIKIFKGPLRAK